MKPSVGLVLFSAALASGENAGAAVTPCLDAPSGWLAVLGSLTQVAVDKSVVCGVNAFDKNKVFCTQKKQPASWWQLQNVAFKEVAVRDGVVYGIQTDGKLVTGPSGPTATFVEVPTPFCEAADVVVDGTKVCVVTTRSQVFCASTSGAGFPGNVKWQGLDGTVTQIALAGSTLYGVNAQNQLWSGTVTDARLASGVASWTLVPNQQFTKVSYDGLRVCGVTPSLKVVCSTSLGSASTNNVPTQWSTLEGELVQVSHFGTSLYGVDAAGHIFVQDLTPAAPTTTPAPPPTPSAPNAAAWTVVPTPQIALVTVSSFGSNVCGTDRAGSIYCSAFNAATPSIVSWVKLQGALKQVVVGANGVLYGVNSANGIYYAPTCKATPGWVQQWGALNNIAVDGSVVCGVNGVSQIYCSWLNTQTSTPNWTLLDGSLKQIVVANGVLFGLDATNKLWTGSAKKISSGTASWKAIANCATYSQISYDGIRLCGVLTGSNKIQCADAGLATSPNWYDLPGASANMAQVSLQRENMFVLTTNSTLLYRGLDAGDDKC